MATRNMLNSLCAGGKEQIRQVRHDEPDDLCALSLEEPRGFILLIAQMQYGCLHLFARGRLHRSMVIDDPGNSHHSYASSLGDLSEGGATVMFHSQTSIREEMTRA